MHIVSSSAADREFICCRLTDRNGPKGEAVAREMVRKTWFGAIFAYCAIRDINCCKCAMLAIRCCLRLSATVSSVRHASTRACAVSCGRAVDDVYGPLKSLKGFTRVTLRPGETTVATLPLPRETYVRFDPQSNTMRQLW